MTEKMKPKLLVEWPCGDDRYRLVQRTPTAYVIEKLGQDNLGEPRWDRIDMGSDRLIEAILFLLGEEEPVLSPAPEKKTPANAEAMKQFLDGLGGKDPRY